MIHLDLFSGIGGFAYAADQVFGDVEHIFCDNDKFCQQVLKKHWPEAPIYDDIRTITKQRLTAYAKGIDDRGNAGDLPQADELQTKERQEKRPAKPSGSDFRVDLLTGGFPCQPFSAAGLRRGTADDRHLWPEMLRVIRLTKPQWVIAENVRGLLTLQEGVVFEQVCTDLEAEGYAVWPFIIPAVAVNAPHRRDRVWFVAHRQGSERPREWPVQDGPQAGPTDEDRTSENPLSQRSRGRVLGPGPSRAGQSEAQVQDEGPGFDRDWTEIAAELCGMAYEFSAELDGRMTPAKHRADRIKALGNAIVPAVAVEIMQGIKLSERNT